jgi:hypothetical protein
MALLTNNFIPSTGLNVAEAWISNIQLLHDTLNCTNEKRLTYTILMITGEALKWWKFQVELIGPDVVGMVCRGNKQYFPKSQKQLRARKF